MSILDRLKLLPARRRRPLKEPEAKDKREYISDEEWARSWSEALEVKHGE